MNNTTQGIEAGMLSEREKQITLGFYLVTFVLGLVGNSLVLVIITKKRLKRTVNDMFIMNLAVTDLTLIFFIPLNIYDLLRTLPATVFTCHFVKPLMTVSFLVSIFTLTSMAVYRCRVILNPFRPEMKDFWAFILVGLIWLSSFIVMVPMMVVTKPFKSGCKEKWPSFTHRKAYTAALFVIQYLLPLMLIAVAYIRIGLDLNKAYFPTSFSFRTKHSEKQANLKARTKENKQVVKTLATIVIMFALCMLPGQVAWMLLDFGSEKQKQTAVVCIKFGVITSVFHSCMNPLIYGTLTRQFRRGYVKYLSYLLCCCQSHSLVQQMRMIRLETSKLDSKRRIHSMLRHESRPSSGVIGNDTKRNMVCIGGLRGYLDRSLLDQKRDKSGASNRTAESRL